ncbi:hypothetical protein SNE40_003820 [Patella caerulea]|uniref:Potassium channel domain-containing protein n=1 Tax=Patella caerulea TaxID=87958 RepID=A0AAN8QFT0_PATCE
MEPDPDVIQSSESVRLKRFIIKCLKKFLVFLISQVGLTCMMVGYTIGGGFLFVWLESGHSKEVRENIGNIRHDQVKILWDITANLNILYEKNWTVMAESVFLKFQTDIYHAVKDSGWDGQDSITKDVGDEEWSFAGSLLYSVTVITTIGYGHLTPRTMEGRIATIFYAVIGIPLFMLCLSNIGSLMAQCFRIFWKHLKYTQFFKPKRQNQASFRSSTKKPLMDLNQVNGSDAMAETVGNEAQFMKVMEVNIRPEVIRIPISVCLCIVALYIFLGALLFQQWEEGWSYMDASYFSFVTLSTIGFGDLVPGYAHDSWGNQYKRVACTLYLLFGLALLAMCFELLQSEVREISRRIARALGIVEE